MAEHSASSSDALPQFCSVIMPQGSQQSNLAAVTSVRLRAKVQCSAVQLA